MPPSQAYEKWPAIRRLIDEAIEKGDLPYQMLADVEYHARRHQLALTFHDAVELVRTFQQEAGRRRALADVAPEQNVGGAVTAPVTPAVTPGDVQGVDVVTATPNIAGPSQ